MIIDKKKLYGALMAVLLTGGCTSDDQDTPDQPDRDPPDISVIQCSTEKSFYAVNDAVRISVALQNNDDTEARITHVKVRIRKLSASAGSYLLERSAGDDVVIGPGEVFSLPLADVWTIPASAGEGVYGIFLHCETTDTLLDLAYQTFFRVANTPVLEKYEITRDVFNGMDVLRLDGGLSAEMAVEKSAEALTAGISHSWSVHSSGQGPEAVLSSPAFLEKSVQQTVDFYNDLLGEDASIETVVIGTGVPSTTYLAGAMKAPVLPLHFLVGVTSVTEVRTILRYANTHDLPSYATVGYDFSIVPAVAWIKLLDMPEPYAEFLQQHHVKNVALIGYLGSADGENKAKRVADGRSKYDPESLYVMYPQGGTASDQQQLDAKLSDIAQTSLSGLTQVADWESGILQQQVNSFAASIRQKSAVSSIRLVTSSNDIPLWDLGTYTMLAFIHKNRSSYEGENTDITGVTLNPYLIAHPFYESRLKYIPFLYWQGNPAATNVQRLMTTTRTAIESYFPDVAFEDLYFQVNSTNNFGGAQQANQMKDALTSNGLSAIGENDYYEDEIWDPGNGMEAACEVRAEALLSSYTAPELKAWNESLTPLTIADLEDIASRFPVITVTGL